MEKKYIKTSFLTQKKLFIFLILIEISFLLFQTFYQTLQGDENEHLYDAYMVFLKYSPYLDFFEHHNPLMWYITAPLYLIYENNVDIYYVARLLMFICVLITGIFTYKTAQKLALPEYCCQLAVCFYFGFDILKLTGIQFRPDPPMALFTTMGLYYLISYLADKKRKNLLLSVSSFAISFWLLQKSVAFITPVAVFLILLVLLKKISIKDLIFASFIPLILSLAYLFYLYQTDALELYFTYNYLGNIKNTRAYFFFKQNSFTFTYKDPTILFCLLATLFYLVINIKKHVALSLVATYIICSFLIVVHVIYSADMHYMLPFLPLFSIIVADLLQKFPQNSFKISLLSMFILCQLWFDNNLIKQNIKPLSEFISINKFITHNTTSDDEVIIDATVTGIKKQAEGYYYFGPKYVIQTVHNIIPYKPLPNYVEIIVTKRPKIINSLIIQDAAFARFLYQNYQTVCPNGIQCFYMRKY